MSGMLFRWTKTSMVVRRHADRGQGSVQLCFHPPQIEVCPWHSVSDAQALLDHQYVSIVCQIDPDILISSSGVLRPLLEGRAHGMSSIDWQVEDSNSLHNLCPAEDQLQAPRQLGT